MKKYKKNILFFYVILLTGICTVFFCILVLAESRKAQQVIVRAGNINITNKTYQLEQGRSVSLKAFVTPGSKTGSISYHSSRKDIASVNRKGKVEAKKTGTAKITVSVSEKNNKKITAWVWIKVIQRRKFTYEISELTAQRGNNKIYGILYKPQEVQRMPAVIYSHGFGGSYRSGDWYARALAEKGYAVYCFDFCGGGGIRSDGSALDMSIFTEQSDLEAVLQVIRKQNFIDTDHIFLFGESQGGVVSAITAAKHSDEIRGLILLYPAFVLVDDTKERFRSVDEIPDRYHIMGMEVGKEYAQKLLDYDVYHDIRKYEKNVLIVHGDADRIVPLRYSEKAVKEYRFAELKVIRGAGHGFDSQENDTALSYALDFLKMNI